MNPLAVMTSSTQRHTERIGTGATAEQKRLIAEAAAVEGRTLAAFVLAHALEAARLIGESRRAPTPGTFEVLCRIDAFADYVAEVEADSPEEAAELARDNHADYKWDQRSVQEFDARLYVTLDADGDEIERTQIGDF